MKDLTVQDDLYIHILMEPLRKCAKYKPAFGSNEQEGVNLDQFQILYGQDPLYHWVGLDSKLMYAAHKAAGGMTSIYRQLGVGCERLFREILIQNLGLNSTQVRWNYAVIGEDGKKSQLTLDGRIDLSYLAENEKKLKYKDWLARICESLNIKMDERNIHGSVFEVRQGYKSADSKRQNADLRSGIRAYAEGYIPVIMVFSQQINKTIERRYRGSSLLMLTGDLMGDDTTSTFAFCKNIVGFDMYSFFERTSPVIRKEFLDILSNLLSPS